LNNRVIHHDESLVHPLLLPNQHAVCTDTRAKWCLHPFDFDQDGVGDLCDNCPPWGTPWREYVVNPGVGDPAATRNPDQANCNEDAEVARFIALYPEYLGIDGNLTALTVAEYNSFNVEGVPFYHYDRKEAAFRGDACDPTPCAKPRLQMSQLPSSWFAQQQCDALGPGGLATGQCIYAAPLTLSLEPVSGFDGVPAGPAEVGLRYCRCDAQNGNEHDRRTHCRDSALWDCQLDPGQYYAGTTPWKTMSVGQGAPSVSKVTLVDFTNLYPIGEEWDSFTDIERITGVQNPAQPWTVQDSHIQGGAVLNGVLWAHTVSLNSVPTQSMGNDAFGRPVVQMANSYASGDHRISKRSSAKPPRLVTTCQPPCVGQEHAMPWELFCLSCGFTVYMPWLSYVTLPDGSVQVELTTQNDSQFVTDLVSPDVVTMWLSAGNLSVLASEPEYRLTQAGTPLREVVLNPSTLVVAGFVALQSGRMGFARPGHIDDGAFARAVGTRGERAFAFAGTTGELFTLVRDELGSTRFGVWRDGEWAEHELAGEKLLVPRAMTYQAREDALYVLEKGDDKYSAVTLSRVFVGTGAVQKLGPIVKEGGLQDLSISVMYDELLLVGVSQPDKLNTRVESLAIAPGGKLTPVGWLESRDGSLAGTVRADKWGLHYPVFDPGGSGAFVLLDFNLHDMGTPPEEGFDSP
jgi:hypothetical protein